MLVTRLKAHEAERRESAAADVGNAEGDAEDGAEDDANDGEAESYNVKKIHSMELREGAVWYKVEWDGWFGPDGLPELTWEPEQHLDGCDDALAAFYTDPEHRAEGCVYGSLPVSSCMSPALFHPRT